jgi:hypothetical protein
VLSQPASPNQTCTVHNGSGTVAAENVGNIIVHCILNKYTIGGTVSGLPEGDQVVLQNNETNNLVISNNGIFTFAAPLDDGSEYKVTIHSLLRRRNWTCELDHAAGTLSGKKVTDVLVDCYPKAVLQAEAGIRKVRLKWNSHDFSNATFNLCVAQGKTAIGGSGNCFDLKKGMLKKKVKSPLTVSPLTNDIPYRFQLVVDFPGGRQRFSQTVLSIPIGGLNDSGIDWCANNNTNFFEEGKPLQQRKSCNVAQKTHPGQDALHGRDAMAFTGKLAKTGAGATGFDFTRLCTNGEIAGKGKCPPNTPPGEGLNNWACTRDNVTGLIWEIKTESGLRSKNNTYTWYNPDETVNGGNRGLKNGGRCRGSGCDTQAYIRAVNKLGLCGADDWRLPTKRELLSIVHNGIFNPAIDIHFFPNTSLSNYWTSSPYPELEKSAWQVHFRYGEASINDKIQGNHVRLVRGRTVTFGLDNP